MAHLLACLFQLACVRPPQPVRPPEPGLTPLALGWRATGIGVSRAALQSAFEQSPAGFTFHDLTAVLGQPRVFGASQDGAASVELIGPASDLYQASFMVQHGAASPTSVFESIHHLLGFIRLAAPSLEDDADWFYETMITAFQQGSATTVLDTIELELRATRATNTSTITFTVRGK